MTYKHSKLNIFHFLFVLAIVILAYIYFGPCKQTLYISEKIEEAKRDSSIIALHNKKFNLEAEKLLRELKIYRRNYDSIKNILDNSEDLSLDYVLHLNDTKDKLRYIIESKTRKELDKSHEIELKEAEYQSIRRTLKDLEKIHEEKIQLFKYVQ